MAVFMTLTASSLIKMASTRPVERTTVKDFISAQSISTTMTSTTATRRDKTMINLNVRPSYKSI